MAVSLPETVSSVPHLYSPSPVLIEPKLPHGALTCQVGEPPKDVEAGAHVGDMPNFPQSLWEPPEELEPLTTASALGQLDKVHTIFSQWLVKQRPNPTTGIIQVGEFHPALSAAVMNNHPTVVAYLLSQSVAKHSLPIRQAIAVKSAGVFEALLRNGWDINQPLGRTDPPALA